jgi:hypothetical protein
MDAKQRPTADERGFNFAIPINEGIEVSHPDLTQINSQKIKKVTKDSLESIFKLS